MPVTYAVYPELNIVLVTFSGLVQAEENLSQYLSYREHPDYDGMQHVLMDLASFRYKGNVFLDLRDLAQKLAPHYVAKDPRSRTSVFAPGDYAFRSSRFYMESLPPEMARVKRVFRNAEDALRFVDLDPEAPEVAQLLRPAPALQSAVH